MGRNIDFHLTGSRIILTGASAGIGRETALRFASAGARMILVARRAALLRELKREIDGLGYPEPIIMPLDVTDGESAAKIDQEARSSLGGVDVLVNCAGRSDPSGAVLDEELWRDAMDLNFHAKRRLVDAVLPELIASGAGRIVNFIGSFEPFGPSASSAASAATRVWSKGLSRTIARSGTTINCIAPGRVDSEQAARKFPVETRQSFIDNNIPAGRFGHPHEVAHLVLFLSSPLADYITGETIHVDGGLHRHA